MPHGACCRRSSRVNAGMSSRSSCDTTEVKFRPSSGNGDDRHQLGVRRAVQTCGSMSGVISMARPLSATACSTAFSSSRMLPGQSYDISARAR